MSWNGLPSPRCALQSFCCADAAASVAMVRHRGQHTPHTVMTVIAGSARVSCEVSSRPPATQDGGQGVCRDGIRCGCRTAVHQWRWARLCVGPPVLALDQLPVDLDECISGPATVLLSMPSSRKGNGQDTGLSRLADSGDDAAESDANVVRAAVVSVLEQPMAVVRVPCDWSALQVPAIGEVRGVCPSPHAMDC